MTRILVVLALGAAAGALLPRLGAAPRRFDLTFAGNAMAGAAGGGLGGALARAFGFDGLLAALPFAVVTGAGAVALIAAVRNAMARH